MPALGTESRKTHFRLVTKVEMPCARQLAVCCTIPPFGKRFDLDARLVEMSGADVTGML